MGPCSWLTVLFVFFTVTLARENHVMVQVAVQDFPIQGNICLANVIFAAALAVTFASGAAIRVLIEH
jgi:hypothetical protein